MSSPSRVSPEFTLMSLATTLCSNSYHSHTTVHTRDIDESNPIEITNPLALLIVLNSCVCMRKVCNMLPKTKANWMQLV